MRRMNPLQSVWIVGVLLAVFPLVVLAQPIIPLDVVDEAYEYGGGYIDIGATATVQEISLTDTQNNGLDIHVNKIIVALGSGNTASASDIASIRVTGTGVDETASVSSFPVTVCSGIDYVILDGGTDTLWVEVTVAAGATHGAILELQTWVVYTEGATGDDYSGRATDGAPEALRDVTPPTVIGVTPIALDNGDVGPVSVSITFSEAMDTAINPSPTITALATDPYTITGSSWSDGDTKWTGAFTFNDDDEQATGVYDISGFKDAAENEMLPDTSHTVDVDTTEAPPPNTAAVFRVTLEGDVLADGAYYGQEFYSRSADVAEWVSVSEPVAPGDVLELDPENPGHYRKSRGPCSHLVAGVVSTDPGFVLGTNPSTLDLGPWTGDSGLRPSDSALLALIGIVPVKVTDEGGPIRPGDLLVVSSTLGYAMRWNPSDGVPCGLVGKALEPLTDASGVILVLLMAH